MKIGIFTRSMNYKLYQKSMSTVDLGYPMYRFRFTTSDGYFYRMLRTDVDIAINIDEDAFILNNERLRKLIEYFLDNKYANCGSPDGGMKMVRGHNPLITNPFFNILDLSQIRKNFSQEKMNEYKIHKKEYEKKTPFELMKAGYFYDIYESYYPFFLWISQEYKVLYLDSEQHSDDYSTILHDHNGKPFLAHSWYSRDYGRDEFHTKRIEDLYNWSIKGKEVHKRKHPMKDAIVKIIDKVGYKYYFRIKRKYLVKTGRTFIPNRSQ